MLFRSNLSGILLDLRRQFPAVRIDSLRDLYAATGNRSYLYYEDDSAGRFVFFPEHLPSQYMRQLIAAELGMPQWDWRLSGREERLLATTADAAALLAAHR